MVARELAERRASFAGEVDEVLEQVRDSAWNWGGKAGELERLPEGSSVSRAGFVTTELASAIGNHWDHMMNLEKEAMDRVVGELPKAWTLL